jgi:hypothetical protein
LKIYEEHCSSHPLRCLTRTENLPDLQNKTKFSGEFKLYSSPNIIRIIKSRRISCTGHVPPKGEKRNAYRILVGKPEG